MNNAVQLQLFTGDPGAGPGQRWRRGREHWVLPGRDHFEPARWAVVRITDAEARPFVETHHYSGSYPAARLRYGLVDQWTGELGGAAVLSVPVNKLVVTGAFPDLQPYEQSLELGRFVLLDEVGFCGETWFLARAYQLAAAAGVRGVVSFSDPMARTTAAGQVIFPGHIGRIYLAANATYCGRATARPIALMPDGRVLSDRALQKVRKDEQGHGYVEELLRSYGARPRTIGQPGARWLVDALDDVGARRSRHPGNHRYCFRLGPSAVRRRTRLGLVAEPYPRRNSR